MKTIKKTLTIIAVLAILYTAWSLMSPGHSQKTTTDIGTTIEVFTDKMVSALESRVGKTEIALAHYKTAHEAKRSALIQLKALKADCERKVSECKTAIAGYEAKGNESAAETKRAELITYENQVATLSASVDKAETSYKEFDTFLKNKRIELKALKARTSSLKSELTILNGADAKYAMEHAREIEDEIKSSCSRLEAEIEVQRLDEEKL